MDFPVIAPPSTNDVGTLLLGTRIFILGVSYQLVSEKEDASQDAVRENVNLETRLRMLTRIQSGKNYKDVPAVRFWTGRFSCDCYPILTA